MSLFEYLKEHVALLVVMIFILLAIVALAIWLLILLYQKRQEKPPEETEEQEESKEETSQDEPKPLEENDEISKQEDSEMKKQVPDKKTEPQKAKEKEPQKIAKPAPAKPATKAKPTAKEKPAPATKAAGKWVLYEEDRGGFGFRLLASNGEIMLKSSSPYASLQSAKAGIKTYQDNIAADRLEVVETKKGNFFVQVNNASKRMLATSADYPTRSSCESALSSIKRWAQSTTIVTESDDEKE